MKRYKNTFFTIILAVTIGLTAYFAINGFNFNSETIAERQPKYSQVRIFATSDADFQKIQDAELYIDHANTKLGHYSDAWLSEYEISLLRNSGVPFEVLVDDWQTYYDNQPKMTELDMQKQMEESSPDVVIAHSIYGTMGGYMTYNEVVQQNFQLEQLTKTEQCGQSE
jgi:hypothetical protein